QLEILVIRRQVVAQVYDVLPTEVLRRDVVGVLDERQKREGVLSLVRAACGQVEPVRAVRHELPVQRQDQRDSAHALQRARLRGVRLRQIWREAQQQPRPGRSEHLIEQVDRASDGELK